MARFEGKVAVITGAARGMGLSTARALAGEGARVALLDLPSADFETALHTLSPDSALSVPCDVSDETAVAEAARQVAQHYGVVHLLVNIAGINTLARIEDMTVEQWDRMYAVNVTGMFLTIKHFVPLMTSGGAIVNMGSVSAFVGSDGYAAYVTSKGAVLSLTKSAAQELAPHGIRVNAVAPGWVDTQFTADGLALADDPAALRASAGSAHVLGRIAHPDEIGRAIPFLLSDAASFVTGETLFVDGGFMVKR